MYIPYWMATGTMLIGIGTIMIGGAAVAQLWIEKWSQIKFKEAKEQKEQLDNYQLALARTFQAYYASEEAIVFSYPENEQIIVRQLAERTNLPEEFLREQLRRAFGDDGQYRGDT